MALNRRIWRGKQFEWVVYEAVLNGKVVWQVQGLLEDEEKVKTVYEAKYGTSLL